MKTPKDIMKIAQEVSPQAASLLMLMDKLEEAMGLNKTQPQRLLESIIPNKAIQVCNAGDWPTVEDQKRYWQERDEHLDKIESNALWFDNKAKQERSPFA